MDQTSRRCTVEATDGTFCDRPSIIDGPFPICPTHARRLYEHVRDILACVDPGYLVGVARNMMLMDQREITRRQWLKCDRAYAEQIRTGIPIHKCEVYYLALDGLIKIGCTTKLKKRIASYPPHAKLLATEPGFREREQQRHRQFAHLRFKGEWFTDAPELREFIQTL